jgi:hypothetical protein
MSARHATPVTRWPSVLISALAIVRESSICRRTGGAIGVDEKLTELRDEPSLDGIEGTQEKGAELRLLGHKPMTSNFRRHSALLDAEEVRGSNPLAPTDTA